MKHTLLRILCLNLALILLLSFSVTALAAAPEETDSEAEWEPVEVPEWAFAAGDYGSARARAEAAHPRPEAERGTPLLTAPETLGTERTYSIKIGAYCFESDTAASGPGWSYLPDESGETGALLLTDYNGGPIAASGDLTIYTNGAVTVQGTSPGDGSSGYEGIDVLGGLILEVESGTLTVNGGSGTYRGGDAVHVGKRFTLYLYDGDAVFTGGDVLSEGLGGDGIRAAELIAVGETMQGIRLTARGGGGPSVSAASVAGCGVSGGEIWLDVDAEIAGGSAFNAAPAVFFGENFTTGLANITLYGGKFAEDEYAWPVQYKGAPDVPVDPITDEAISGPLTHPWYIHPHTTLKTDEYHSYFDITVNRYTVTLYGMGGRRDGVTFTDLVDYYPAAYHFSDYLFTREGYVQTAWINASGDLVPLDIWFRPEENTEFEADWLKTDPGDIVLNGMGGRIEKSDESFAYRYTGAESVTLPEALYFTLGEEDAATPILGWHTGMLTGTDADGIMAGAWYSAGSDVQPNAGEPTVLYASGARSVTDLVYHAAEGVPKAGGNIIVHRSYVTDTDLDLYAIDGREYLTAPEGCRFAGWAETPDGEVKYAAGDAVRVVYGAPTHLYAVWKPFGGKYSLPECDALVDPGAGTVTLKPTRDWAESLNDPKKLFGVLYDESGQMIGIGVFTADMLDDESEGLALGFDGKRLPLVKIFGLNAADAPAGKNIRMDLQNMEPDEGDGAILTVR